MQPSRHPKAWLAGLASIGRCVAPGAESHAALYRHPGTEMVLVLHGKLVIFLGFERYELEPGDSITFPSTTPHRYLNPTEETTRAVTVILPDGGMHGPPTNKRRP